MYVLCVCRRECGFHLYPFFASTCNFSGKSVQLLVEL